SIAERGELGSTSVRLNFPARNFLPTENTLPSGANEIVSFTAGWPVHKSLSFSGVSRVICASGNFSRSRSSAGVVITASPSQLVPRTKILGADGSWQMAVGGFIRRCRRFRLWTLDFGLWTEPVSSGYGPRTSWPGRGARRLHAPAIRPGLYLPPAGHNHLRGWEFFRPAPVAISPGRRDNRPRRKVRNRSAGRRPPGTGWWNNRGQETAGAARGHRRVDQSANRE